MNTFKHPKAQKVLGFLQAKGLLLVQNMKPRHFEKIPVLDALWVAEHIEPRVLEVLPAALLHYPRTFLFPEQLTDELKKSIKKMKKGGLRTTGGKASSAAIRRPMSYACVVRFRSNARLPVAAPKNCGIWSTASPSSTASVR